MDFARIKLVVLQKYTENKNFLSKLDIWSFIVKPNFYTFKVSGNTFNSIKNSKDFNILDQGIVAGKLAVQIEIPEIKVDDFIINQLQIIQDIEIKSPEYIYQSGNYAIKNELNSRNTFNQKELIIFDIKLQNNILSLKLLSNNTNTEFIELETE